MYDPVRRQLGPRLEAKAKTDGPHHQNNSLLRLPHMQHTIPASYLPLSHLVHSLNIHSSLASTQHNRLSLSLSPSPRSPSSTAARRSAHMMRQNQAFCKQHVVKHKSTPDKSCLKSRPLVRYDKSYDAVQDYRPLQVLPNTKRPYSSAPFRRLVRT